MTIIASGKGIKITQTELQQILLRGKGDGGFAETVNKEISLLWLFLSVISWGMETGSPSS